MVRVTWFGLMLVVGCSQDKNQAPSGSPGAPAAAAPASSAPAASSSLANAAAKLTDACPLVPPDMVKRLIPEAKPPVGERYPLRCSVYGKEAALEISFDTGPAPSGKDGDRFTDIAQGGIVQRLSSKFPGDVYVTLGLGTDDSGTNHNLHVEVNGLGKDHKEDALELARYVVAHLR